MLDECPFPSGLGGAAMGGGNGADERLTQSMHAGVGGNVFEERWGAKTAGAFYSILRIIQNSRF